MYDDLGENLEQGGTRKSMVFSDKEIEVMMNYWAECTIGYNQELGQTNKYHQKHRNSVGLKLWEQMTIEERQKEFFNSLKRDLEITSTIFGNDVTGYVLERAYNPKDPMAEFYKGVLIKLGATVTEEGQLRIPANLNERLEKCLLYDYLLLDIKQQLDQGLKQPTHEQKLDLKLRLD